MKQTSQNIDSTWKSLHWRIRFESLSDLSLSDSVLYFSADRGANFGKDAAVASKYNLTAKRWIK